jgi:hypothetical protein
VFGIYLTIKESETIDHKSNQTQKPLSFYLTVLTKIHLLWADMNLDTEAAELLQVHLLSSQIYNAEGQVDLW